MNEVTKVQEDVEVGVSEQSLQIPVRVKVSSINKAPMEFGVSIDDVGQIVVTPTSKDVTFLSANTDSTVEYETPIMDQETVIIDETDNYIEKEVSILINATMLVEENTTTNVSADVDEIGQCVIYPMSKENVFTTATIGDSLNLITEEMELHNYCDYKIINPGGRWYVKDPRSKLIGQGFESLNAAKIFVCETEIDRLSKITEAVSDNDTEAQQEVPENVEAEVITEAVIPEFEKKDEFSPIEVEKTLIQLTETYTEEEGGVRCDTEQEQKACEEVLKKHYSEVTLDKDGSKFTVFYSSPITAELTESIDNDKKKMDVLVRFLQGDVTLVSDPEREPKESFILITSEGNSDYYYDPESDAIGIYKR